MLKERNSHGSNGSEAGSSNDIDSFTRGFVRKSARELAGRFGFKKQDRAEIEQRLYLKLAKELHRADPNDPKWKAFVAVTVRRHIVSMVRDQEAAKRDHRRACSLNVTVRTPEGLADLADTVGEHQGTSSGSRVSRQRLMELTLDVTECIADINDDRHREFCERLKHDSIAQIARDMGIPRTTLNFWLAKLRSRFEERGLKDYL